MTIVAVAEIGGGLKTGLLTRNFFYYPKSGNFVCQLAILLCQLVKFYCTLLFLLHVHYVIHVSWEFK